MVSILDMIKKCKSLFRILFFSSSLLFSSDLLINLSAIPYMTKDFKPENNYPDSLVNHTDLVEDSQESDQIKKEKTSSKTDFQKFQKIYREKSQFIEGVFRENIVENNYFFYAKYDLEGDKIADIIEVFGVEIINGKKFAKENPRRYYFNNRLYNPNSKNLEYLCFLDSHENLLNGDENYLGAMKFIDFFRIKKNKIEN